MKAVSIFAVVLALILTGCTGDGDKPASPTTTPPPGAQWNPIPGRPFTEPAQISQGKDVAVTFDVKEQTIDVSGSALEGTKPFAATPGDAAALPPKVDGPTLHVTPGGRINVTVINRTDQDTNIHYHGLHVSPLGESDNIFRVFPPNTTSQSVVNLPANHSVGTYWYHVHPHGKSRLQVNAGLSGLLIVDGLEKVLPPPLQPVTQRQFALREVFTYGDQVLNEHILAENQAGKIKDDQIVTTRLVNGQLRPTLELKQNEYQLWRLANIGPDIFFHLRLRDPRPAGDAGRMPDLPFLVIAEDGTPVFDGPAPRRDLLEIPPGKRFDVLVFGGGTPGTYELRTNDKPGPDDEQGNPVFTLATVTIGADAAPPVMSPAAVTVTGTDDGARQSLADLRPDRDRVFVFSFEGNTGEINGQAFSADRTDVAVELGAVEDWTILNITDVPHPFHIHVNDFQVLSVNDKLYDATNLQEVVSIPQMENFVPGKVVIRNHFRDFTGWFVFHCHILGHEDSGMMATIQVLGPGEKPSPPPSAGTMGGHATTSTRPR